MLAYIEKGRAATYLEGLAVHSRAPEIVTRPHTHNKLDADSIHAAPT